MADLLKDIEAYLIAEHLGTADGTDLFRDKIPDSPNAVVVLTEYGGSPATLGVEAMDRSVQIQTRETTYAAARSKCWSIYNRLISADDPIKNLTATRWGILHGRSAPIKLKEDKQARVIFVCSIGITTSGD